MQIIKPSGPKPWRKHQILKMAMECTSPMPSSKSVESARHPIATGNCLLHHMCSGKKKSQHMSLQTFCSCFQEAMCAVKILDHCHEKNLDDNKNKILFFIYSPRNTFKIMCIMVIVISIQKLWNTSRMFSKAIMMLICSRRPIDHTNNIMIKAKPLVEMALLSLFMTITIHHLHPPLHHPIVPITNLMIGLTLVSSMMQACHKCIINVVSAKIPHNQIDWLQNA